MPKFPRRFLAPANLQKDVCHEDYCSLDQTGRYPIVIKFIKVGLPVNNRLVLGLFEADIVI
jgi:hypothetical protein